MARQAQKAMKEEEKRKEQARKQQKRKEEEEKREAKRKAEAQRTQPLCGVGMTLEAATDLSGGCCVVRGMKKGGPVDLCDKVQVGDRLVRVNEMPCVGVSREAIKEYVIGPAGSDVELVFERHHSDGGLETMSVVLTRTLPTPAVGGRNGLPVSFNGKRTAGLLHLAENLNQATARLKSKVGSCYEEASRLLEKAFSSRENSSAALRVAIPVLAVVSAAVTHDPMKSPAIKPGSLKSLAEQTKNKSRWHPKDAEKEVKSGMCPAGMAGVMCKNGNYIRGKAEQERLIREDRDPVLAVRDANRVNDMRSLQNLDKDRVYDTSILR